MPRRFQVLIVCSGNTCRSPMAAGLLRRLLAGGGGAPGAVAGAGEAVSGETTPLRPVRVVSAGTAAAPGFPATEEAIAVAAQAGVDLHAHRSRPLDARLVSDSDLILVMEAQHREAIRSRWPEAAARTRLLTELAREPGTGGVADPIGGGAAAYARTWERLEGLLRRAAAGIRRRVEGSGDE